MLTTINEPANRLRYESALRRPEGLMPWSLNIGTIAGTAVRVHITFLPFLGWI
jgi:hypothetical protein